MNKNYTPMPYHQMEGTPIGSFEALLINGEWTAPVYHHEQARHLTSGEVEEFSRLVTGFFGEYRTKDSLRKLFGRYGKRLKTEGYDTTYGFCFRGKLMEYTVNLCGNVIQFYPYRTK